MILEKLVKTISFYRRKEKIESIKRWFNTHLPEMTLYVVFILLVWMIIKT